MIQEFSHIYVSQFVSSTGLTPNAFARKIGIDPSNFNKMLDGKQKITEKTIEKICRTYPQVNIEWLKNGDGQMLNATKKTQDVDHTGTDEFSLVPLINIDSVGSMHSNNALTNSEQYTERLIPFTGAKPGDRAIYQSGDSMTPTIPPGSIMQIRKVDDWQEYLGYGNTFVLWLNDDRRITKQILKYTPDPEKYVTCHSFNPDSADEELPKKMIREVWKVIKVLTDKGW